MPVAGNAAVAAGPQRRERGEANTRPGPPRLQQVRQTTYFLTTRGTARLYSAVEGRGSAPRRGPNPCCPGAGSGHQAVTWRPADACSRLRGQGARAEARPPPPGAVRTRGQFTKAGRDPPALAKARQGGERRGTPWLSTHQHRRTGSDDVPQIWAAAGLGSERHRGVARGSTGRRDKADGRRDC